MGFQLQLTYQSHARATISIEDARDQLEHLRLFAGRRPCKQTVIGWCNDGTLDAIRTPLGWMIYEESFIDFVDGLSTGRPVFGALAVAA